MVKNNYHQPTKKRPLVLRLFIWLLLTVQYLQILSPLVYAINDATPSALTAPTELTASDSASIATTSGEIAPDASPSALTASTAITAPTASSAAELIPDLSPSPTATPSVISDLSSASSPLPLRI